jgi:HEAT repeat protein
MRKCLIVLAAVVLMGAGCEDKTKNLSSSDSKERAQAISAVSAAADEKTVEKVAAMVRSDNVQTASSAVLALAKISSPRAVETLRQVVVADQRPEVRQAAVISLSQRTEPEAAEMLRDTLVRDKSPEVRGEAAVGLAMAGNIEDVQVLANAAGRETDPKVTRRQVLAMEHLIGVKFPQPDPKMTPEQRKAQMQRIRTTAMRLAEARKNNIPLGSCKHTPQK